MLHRYSRGQSTLEYTALIAVVVGAIIAINIYLKRGVEGNLRSSADDIGTQYDIEKGSYHQKTNLKSGEQEITHTSMGTTGDSFGGVPGIDFAVKGEIGEGIEAQWTEQAAKKELKEQTTTNVTADVSTISH